jgi:hypothetical protein
MYSDLILRRQAAFNPSSRHCHCVEGGFIPACAPGGLSAQDAMACSAGLFPGYARDRQPVIHTCRPFRAGVDRVRLVIEFLHEFFPFFDVARPILSQQH